MELSNNAKAELRKILEKEIGSKRASLLSETDLQQMGIFLLTLTAESLKKRLVLYSAPKAEGSR